MSRLPNEPADFCNNGPMPVLERIRRNHALEHATLAVLASSGVKGLLAGYSTSGGFWLLAPASASTVEAAANTALERLSSGESHLAISASCGTNLAVASLLATSVIRVAKAIRGGGRSGWPLNAVLVVGALALARPLGTAIQRKLTTLSLMEGMRVSGVRTLRVGRFNLHRIFTEQHIDPS